MKFRSFDTTRSKYTGPWGFINLIPHELMHARLVGYENDIPGGEEAHEPATDLGCIIAGFGVFNCRLPMMPDGSAI